MNTVTAAIAGGVAASLVVTSAMVFALRDDDGKATEVAATKTVCTDEQVVTEKKWGTNSVVGTVLGGAAGAVIGHQIGSGRGNDAATAVGAVGGAVAGNKIARSKYPDHEVTTRQNCREVPVD
ncbi:MAG TPA: glycine zipper 2TM domain-containing protein [Fontimonas sp.]